MTDSVRPSAFVGDIERVAVDVEGVPAASHARLCTVHNNRYDTTYTETDIGHWDWVVDEIGFEEFMAITDEAWREEDCGASIEAYGDVAMLANALDRLRERFTVDVVTARTGVDDAIQAWLAERDIEYNTFHSLPHTETKAALGYDAYIDDKPGLADRLAADQCQYLVKQPWNRAAWRHRWTIAVASVVEAVDRLLANTGEL